MNKIILALLCVVGLQFGIVDVVQANKLSLDINTIEMANDEIKYITNEGQICVYNLDDNQKQTNLYSQHIFALSETVGKIEYFIKEDGTLWQYGDGINIKNAVQIKGINNCIKVCAGYEHTLALLDDGSLYAWGRNDEGQLGNGTFDSSDVPQKVLNLSNIIDISVGDYFSMALDSYGNVFVWGSNFTGELGNGKYTDEYSNINNNSNYPIKVESLTECVQIDSGNQFAAALTQSGKVYIWGTRGGLNPQTYMLFPKLIEDIEDCVQISASDCHLLILSKTGEVWEWGLIDSSVLDSIASDPIKIEKLKNVSRVIAGRTDAFLLTDNTLWIGEYGETHIRNMSQYCLTDISNDDIIPTSDINFIDRGELANELIKRYKEFSVGADWTNGNYHIFRDVFQDDKNKSAVEQCYYFGLMQGTSENLFEPKSVVTMEQALVAFSRMISLINNENIKDFNSYDLYLDNNEISEWARDGIYYLKEKNLLKQLIIHFSLKNILR